MQWFGLRRWPCDQYKIMKNNRAQLKTKRHTNLTYHVTDFIPFLKDQWLKCQNQNQHERSQGKHPAGARCFRSNGQTTATTQTNPGRQLSAVLRWQDSMADPWVKVSRLSDWTSPKQHITFWANAKAPTSSSSTNVLCLLFCVFLTGFCFYEGFVIQQKRF